MKMRGFIKKNKTFVYLLIAALFLRLFLTQFGTLDLDFNSFVAWSNRMVEVGPAGFYDAWSDHNPGYMYVLWFLGFLKAKFPFLGSKMLLHLTYKLPAIMADLATGILIFLTVSRFNKKFALTVAAFYIFNPAVFGNSAMWGQIDSITSFFAFASVFFATSNPFVSAILIAIGTLVKVQAGFIIPLIVLLWFSKFSSKKTITYTITTAIVFLAGFVPFSAGKPFLSFVFGQMVANIGLSYSSVNAFNAWPLCRVFGSLMQGGL